MIGKSIEQLKNVDLENVQKSELADISTIKIDITKSKEERLQQYLEQIRNPYCFTCKGATVKVSFSNTEDTLQDKLYQYLQYKNTI